MPALGMTFQEAASSLLLSPGTQWKGMDRDGDEATPGRQV
jgi:hypothetical protein